MGDFSVQGHTGCTHLTCTHIYKRACMCMRVHTHTNKNGFPTLSETLAESLAWTIELFQALAAFFLLGRVGRL